jgi:hypothetical protein
VKRLHPDAPSLNLQVKEMMIKTLRDEFVAYVGELREATKDSSPAQSDSTSASGDSRDPGVDDLGEMELQIQANAAMLHIVGF